MNRYHSYLNTSATLIDQYKEEEPLSSFLKKFFARNKKYGSRDRKYIAHLCYCYFRMGKMAVQLRVEERILAGLFLCSGANELLKNLKPEWNEKTGLNIEEKCSVLSQNYSGVNFSLNEIFPFENHLSDGISFKEFSRSFLTQPDLFLRIRPGHKKDVLQKLQDSNLHFQIEGEDCIALSNATKVENILLVNKEVVIQDYNSQQIAGLLPVRTGGQTGGYRVWDCCAASGGKSILIHDTFQGRIELTVSDIRDSILANLRKRFVEAGIKNYKSFVVDLTSDLSLTSYKFDLILADVPCSGSGTWGRTPEQLFYFQASEIEKYSSLQKKIVGNVIRALKPGGYFLYITCSVFKKENEEMADFLREKFSMILTRKEVLKGYDKKADTMFAALFQKPL